MKYDIWMLLGFLFISCSLSAQSYQASHFRALAGYGAYKELGSSSSMGIEYNHHVGQRFYLQLSYEDAGATTEIPERYRGFIAENVRQSDLISSISNLSTLRIGASKYILLSDRMSISGSLQIAYVKIVRATYNTIEFELTPIEDELHTLQENYDRWAGYVALRGDYSLWNNLSVNLGANYFSHVERFEFSLGVSFWIP